MIDNIVVLYNTLKDNKITSYQLYKFINSYWIEELQPFYHIEKSKVYMISPELHKIILRKANVINLRVLKELANPELRKLKLSKINIY